MTWSEVTEISGRKHFINMSQIVVVEEYQWTGDVGAVLTSTIRDKDGKPIKFQVRESAEDIVRQVDGS